LALRQREAASARKHPKKANARSTSNGGKERLGKLSNKEFEAHLAKLQAELVKVQPWVQHARLSVVVIFKGRDGAGKGGSSSALPIE